MAIVPAITFEGALRDQKRSIPVRFSAEVDDDGELQLTFENPEPSGDAFRLLGHGFSRGDELRYFELHGTGAGGETIASDTFHVTGYSHGSDDAGHRLSFSGTCREAELVRSLEEAAAKPILIWAFRRFQSFSGLARNLPEGSVWIGGAKPEDGHPQKITGALRIAGPDGIASDAWWGEAEEAADHVFRVMSLAGGLYLRPYVRRRIEGDRDRITVSAYSDAPEAFLPPFHFLNLEPIFACACAADEPGGDASRSSTQHFNGSCLRPITTKSAFSQL